MLAIAGQTAEPNWLKFFFNQSLKNVTCKIRLIFFTGNAWHLS